VSFFLHPPIYSDGSQNCRIFFEINLEIHNRNNNLKINTIKGE
jgi:hypothetical protein